MNAPVREAVLDANILLRYLTDEPRDLADQASHILETAERQRTSLVVAPLTVAEVVYVLESVYHLDRHGITEPLLDFIAAGVVEVLDRVVVTQALSWYRDLAGVHFADAYVAALARARGHGAVISFDRDLRRVPGIRLIQRASDLRPG